MARSLDEIFAPAINPPGTRVPVSNSNLPNLKNAIENEPKKSLLSRIGGFGKQVAQGLAETPLKVAHSATALVKGVPTTIASVKKLNEAKKALEAGDTARAKSLMAETRSFIESTDEALTPRHSEFLGKDVDVIDTPLESVGAGLELGSYLIGGGGTIKAGTSMLRNQFRRALWQGAKTGAIVGGLSGAGRELQADRDGETVGETVTRVGKSTAIGAGAGAAIGAAIPAAGLGVKAGVKAAKAGVQAVKTGTKIVKATPRVGKEVAIGAQRLAKRTAEATDEALNKSIKLSRPKREFLVHTIDDIASKVDETATGKLKMGAKPGDFQSKVAKEIAKINPDEIYNEDQLLDEVIAILKKNHKLNAKIKEKITQSADDLKVLKQNIADLQDDIVVGNKRVADDFFDEVELPVKKAPSDIQDAVRTGIDDDVINFIETASREDKKAFLQMTDLMDRKVKDIRILDQPRQFAGKSILDRAEHTLAVRKASGKRIGEFVDNFPEEKIDITQVFDDLIDDLKLKGIKINKKNIITEMGSEPGKNRPLYQLMIDKLKPAAKSGRTVRNPRSIYQMRQRFFKEFKIAKDRQVPFGEEAVTTAEKYRSQMLGILNSDDIAPGIRDASEEFAVSTKVLQDFVKLMRFKGKLDDLAAKDLRAGEVARRLLSNASDDTMSKFMELERFARKTGFKGKTDWMELIQFSEILERAYGTTQSTSFQGEATKAVQNVAQDAVGTAYDAATLNIGKLLNKTIQFTLGRTSEEQRKALRTLIEQSITR